MKLSVIVPAYNAEETIIKCIESIINVKNINIELIVTNDGSKDSTHEKIVKLMKDYDFIYLQQDNMGLSKTRNRMLDVASGDYILFCDSDDFVNSIGVNKIYNYAMQYDLDICFGTGYLDYPKEGIVVKEEKDSRVKKMNLLEVESGVDYLYEAYRNKVYSSTVQSSLWKKSYLKKNKISFLEGVLYEDVEFTFNSTVRAKRVGFVDSLHFNYVQSESSITRDEQGEIKPIDKSSYNKVVKSCLSTMAENKYKDSKLFNVFFKLVFFDYLRECYKNGDDDDNIRKFKSLLKDYNLNCKERIRIIKTVGFQGYLDLKREL